MFEFLRCQYRMKRLDDAVLDRYVTAGCITEQEKQCIIEEVL